jgi:GWxTD domain-containing protein
LNNPSKYRIGTIALLKGLALILGLLYFGQAKAHTHFTASFLNLREGNNNAGLLLNLEPTLFHIDPATGILAGDLRLTVSFRKSATGQIVQVRQREIQSALDFLSSSNPLMQQLYFQLRPGSYEAIVEIEDRTTRKHHLESFNFQCRDMQASIAISDPVLLQYLGPGLPPTPLLGDHISSSPEKLSMNMVVWAKDPGYFRAKAVLYRKQGSLTSGPTDKDRLHSNEYFTTIQFNAVVDARKGRGQLQQSLDVNDLPHGEYLLEIYLYQEDSLVAEANRSFFIDWKYLGSVFGNLHQSIDMMAWIASPETIIALKQIKDADEQLASFLDFWGKRANPSRETALDAIERYYARVFYANENFSEATPGWQTDRGKAIALYGPPDHQSSLKFNGQLFEIWTYSKWGMRFLFRNDEGTMRRVMAG